MNMTLGQGENCTAALHTMTACELIDAIRTRRLSSLEATRYFIDRIERLDPGINAVPVRDFDRALEAARQADSALGRGHACGALHGLPMTVKESFFVEGLPTTLGNPAWASNMAAADSTTIRKVRKAGAIILGKSNVPLMCADWQSSNSVYGVTHNPWRHNYSPGGSSGGAAAALAMGLSPMELGSDRAGSIRVPAAFCGVYGHKPTWGAVSGLGDSPHGHVSASDIATAGPMGKSAQDLAIFLRVLAQGGDSPMDIRSMELPPPRAATLKDYRIAVWPGDPAVKTSEEITAKLTNLLGSLGGLCRSTTRFQPFFDPAQARKVYSILRTAAVVTGKSVGMLDEYRKIAQSHPEETSVLGRHARAALIAHHEWAGHNEWRNRLRAAWREFFSRWDILICPATLRDAFPIYPDNAPETRTLQVDGEEIDYYDQEFWPGIIGMCYLPSTSMPLGLSRQGLPVGVQVVAAEGYDFDAIHVAGLLQHELFPGPLMTPSEPQG
ncbi:amidase family protein [Candidimonas nitroreducens]|uniref:Amidase domain-containing protein n=1 Tax=Candidimonas nitroreducens TaxID=683354 RepID=A0A225M0Q1_9BURK|nr:amidase family protein [Candidimonas nitroreducens]OWT53780.1 hypothetical protein CEY11_23985 [Candidimonas nitroreducens]